MGNCGSILEKWSEEGGRPGVFRRSWVPCEGRSPPLFPSARVKPSVSGGSEGELRIKPLHQGRTSVTHRPGARPALSRAPGGQWCTRNGAPPQLLTAWLLVDHGQKMGMGFRAFIGLTPLFSSGHWWVEGKRTVVQYVYHRIIV